MKEYLILNKKLKDSPGAFWHRVGIANGNLKLIKETYLVKEIKAAEPATKK